MTVARHIALLAAGLIATAPVGALGQAPAAPSVEAGIGAWQAGRYDEAIRQWRPLADRGDTDAQFNLGHAYRLGRGVPQNMVLAEQWYERAARAGHVEAQAMYGLILFQNGRRREAMPYVQRAAERGDARAQYVYGTALFNGDVVARDWPRAYAFMVRAAASGLPYAQSQLSEMEAHIPQAERDRGNQLAETMARGAPSPSSMAGVTLPQAAAPHSPAVPPRTGAPTARPPAAPPRATPAAPLRSAPATLAATGGRWRIQLGAFSSEANAQRAWAGLRGRLPGLQPFYVRAGAVVRLQAGPLASRNAAASACAAARTACFPVSP